MAICAWCGSRKGKRNCPALGGLICSQCCGANRLKEIECPEDCFYLNQSRQFFSERQEAKQIDDFEREMKSAIGDENRYLDVLQNIEFAILNTYRNRNDITDREVETALEYMLEMGKTELDLPSKFLQRYLQMLKLLLRRSITFWNFEMESSQTKTSLWIN